MKKLVIVSHPNLETSVINKRWIEEMKKYPENYTIHHIDNIYPDNNINVEKEQALIEEHDAVIFQFPLYWYNVPPLLKLWFDSVFTYGWAYGSKAIALKKKNIAFAISLGAAPDDFTSEGKVNIPLDNILSSFHAICNYIEANYKGFFKFHTGISSAIAWRATPESIEKGAAEYIRFLDSI